MWTLIENDLKNTIQYNTIQYNYEFVIHNCILLIGNY